MALISTSRGPAPIATPLVPATPEGSADALAAGQWSELPPAPVPGRAEAAAVWTGEQMLVWGGLRDRSDARRDGASYDPVARTWEVLADSPLAPASRPLSTWTGTDWLLLGGAAADGTSRQQFASYDPQAQRWSRLSLPDGLDLDPLTTSTWTGRELVVVTGARKAAAYDPTGERWRRLDDAPLQDDHGPVAAQAVAHDSAVLLFTSWTHREQTGPATFSGSAGVEIAQLDLPDGSWALRAMPGSPDGISTAFSTPHGLLVPATGPVRPGSGPSPSGLQGWLLADDAWSRLPHGPVDDLRGRSVWTGSALVTADTGTHTSGPGGETLPGAAAAYDPDRQRWERLPSAPVASSGGALVWTGRQLLLWGEVYDTAAYDPSSGSVSVRSGGAVLTPSTDQPSQDAAAARRDGVVPAVASLPLSARMSVTTEAVADDGVWVVSRLPSSAWNADGTVGDPAGERGTDWVGGHEYSEVLLLDPLRERVLRAYPLPALPPQALHVTAEAVYCGRQGDGALPHSMLCRIDRDSLELTVRVFQPEGDGLAVVDPRWTVDRAPLEAVFGELGPCGPAVCTMGPDGERRFDPISLQLES